MPDVKEVVNGLEMSYKYSNVDENNTLVPQWIVLHAIALLKEYERAIKHQSDHLDALLKAKEPVDPTEPDEDNMVCCGACGSPVGYEVLEPSGMDYVRYNYCPNCGRAVKWE